MSGGTGQRLLRFAALLALAAAGIVLVTRFLVVPWVVLGDSMAPSLQPGDRVLVDLWTFRQRLPRRGEVVLLQGPLPAEPVLIKRVTDFPPGARRELRGRLWPGREAEHDGAVWVRGDNVEHSVDSRSFGPVPAERVRGRVIFRYWPLSRAGPIR